jgi:hypothetical protein
MAGKGPKQVLRAVTEMGDFACLDLPSGRFGHPRRTKSAGTPKEAGMAGADLLP